MKSRQLRIIGASLLMLVAFGAHPSAQAALRLAGIFGDHMVLQREQPARIWGWADNDQLVTVQFAGQTLSITTNDDGFWQLELEPIMASSEGRDLQVSSHGEQLLIRDVVVGDVWHASGQSNMAMTIEAVAKRLPQAEEHIANAQLPAIRFRRINEKESAKPLDDLTIKGGWTVCSPNTVSHFSAAAFYFARKLHRQLDVPIGVIDSSRGGTPIEPFIPRDAFASHPTLRRELELGDRGDLQGIRRLAGGVRARDTNWLPARLFHSRIAPITPFAVRGAVWYQGESNCGEGEDPRDYQHKMRALIAGWRKAFGDEKLPFYFVQLPGSGAGAGWPYLREQQRLMANLPNSAMVVTIDLLDGDIHPPNKIDVGERLARSALAGAYQQVIPSSGPLFERKELVNGRVVVHFLHAESGLMVATKVGLSAPKETSRSQLSHFELCDTEGQWHPAEATIQGQTVSVHLHGLRNPIAVRYAYAVSPQRCNLYNRDGLPASPFCSDPTLLKYIPKLSSD